MKVTLGFCEDEARTLLAPYIKLKTQRRPWVIGKWAQTADGYLALPPGQGRWITSDESREHVHLLRGQCDGILVGVETVLADDPMLTNRSNWSPTGQLRQPTRVVLDSNLSMPADCQLVTTSDLSPVVVATTNEAARRHRGHVATLSEMDVEILPLPPGADGRVDLASLLDKFGRQQWTHLLVEGGEQVLRSFIEQGLADELEVYVSPAVVGDTDEPLPHLDVASLPQVASLTPTEEAIGPDRLMVYRLTDFSTS